MKAITCPNCGESWDTKTPDYARAKAAFSHGWCIACDFGADYPDFSADYPKNPLKGRKE